jgi:hypothetical protein
MLSLAPRDSHRFRRYAACTCRGSLQISDLRLALQQDYSASSTACNNSSSLPRDDDNDAASAAGASAAPPATTAQLLPRHSFSDYTAVCCAFSFSSSDSFSFSISFNFRDIAPSEEEGF